MQISSITCTWTIISTQTIFASGSLTKNTTLSKGIHMYHDSKEIHYHSKAKLLTGIWYLTKWFISSIWMSNDWNFFAHNIVKIILYFTNLQDNKFIFYNNHPCNIIFKHASQPSNMTMTKLASSYKGYVSITKISYQGNKSTINLIMRMAKEAICERTNSTTQFERKK